MKRVLFVEGCFDGTVGGSHTCLRTLISKLDRTCYQPSVVFYEDHHIAEDVRALDADVHIIRHARPLQLKCKPRMKVGSRVLGIATRVVQRTVNLWIMFVGPAIQHARFIRRNRIAIVHLNNSLNTNHDWIAAALLARVKLVSHERGISPRLSKTSRILAKVVDHFVCVSRMVFNHLVAEGLPVERMSVVYDGLDLSKFDVGSPAEVVRRRHQIDSDRKVVGVLGNVKEWKGQETLIRATAILKDEWPDILCLIVGAFDDLDPYAKHLMRLTKELNLTSNVWFMGFRQKPGEWLGAMDVVCHTSITPEPFGMVNLEAMYMNRPVIATRIGGPLEIFQPDVDGILIEPGDHLALACAIGGLLSDSEQAQRIAEQGRQTVFARFDARKTAREIESIYASIC